MRQWVPKIEERKYTLFTTLDCLYIISDYMDAETLKRSVSNLTQNVISKMKPYFGPEK